MTRTIMLSERAVKFIDSRRGAMSRDEYANSLIENVAHLSGEGTATEDSSRIIEVIEACRPPPVYEARESWEEVASKIFEYLADAYHGHVPRHVFRAKSLSRGLSREQIARAEMRYRDRFSD